VSRISGEFAVIERYLAPLAQGAAGAFALKNDAAVLSLEPGARLVTTVDCMIAGRHFLPDDPADTVAKKLLRVSLSDLAAMGARPLAYLLSASWPVDTEESWLAAFCGGLADDQARYGVTLVGGDTTATPGPLTLSLTAFGSLAGPGVLDRSSLKPGDDLYLSGTLGDAHLGLRVLRGEIDGLSAAARDDLVRRYRCPDPRVDLGRALLERGLATTAIDVSDGLAQDLGHLLSGSGLGAVVRLMDLPVSEAAEEALGKMGETRAGLLSGGGDYELLLGAAADRRDTLAALAKELSVPLTRLGQARGEPGLSVQDAAGREVLLESAGWTHF